MFKAGLQPSDFEYFSLFNLREFEEIVLLAVAALSTNAYTITIAEDLESETGNVVTTGAVHAAMQRLE
ncbi:hypothetical protein [Dyadobacter arcticus]|uniref:Uncharacterized protein n=1 Tax=Dyadobacter arcticus TaxID=1078754 RepID=A0ABX0UMU5_9BACT|nr:hypothetical protein [Dyadobacter arcticus]NIJ52990.1 hypothetical protein [Dyadobacter arcticus]